MKHQVNKGLQQLSDSHQSLSGCKWLLQVDGSCWEMTAEDLGVQILQPWKVFGASDFTQQESATSRNRCQPVRFSPSNQWLYHDGTLLNM